MGKKGRKAPNGSGSIWQRSDGRYGAAIPYLYHDPETGRIRRDKARTTKRTWEQAHKWFVKTQGELFGTVAVSGEDPELGAFLREWLRDTVEPSVARNTYLKREYAVRVHIGPNLGHLKLSELEPRRLHAFHSRLVRQGLSYATRREIHLTLKMALGQAMRWGLAARNVAEMAEPPKGAQSYSEAEGEVRAITEEQARRFFTATEGKRWRNYYVAAIRTGLRPGELLGLRWGDLDLRSDPGSLKVRRTLDTHYSPPVFNLPKSSAARRTVALHWEAAGAFDAQRAMLESERLPTGPKALVFPSKAGTPMNSDNLRRRHLKPDLRAAGLPELTLHELRHTYASIALFEWRFPPGVVQQTLGHKSITMTMDLYGHLFPGAQEDALRALAKAQRKASDEASGRDVAIGWLSNRKAEGAETA